MVFFVYIATRIDKIIVNVSIHFHYWYYFYDVTVVRKRWDYLTSLLRVLIRNKLPEPFDWAVRGLDLKRLFGVFV